MMTCGTVVAVVVGGVVTVVLLLTASLLVRDSTVEQITAKVATAILFALAGTTFIDGATVVVAAPLIVLLRLALPWKTARIFFDVLLSRSGRITAA
jgi:hypothetical protein